jgi:thymidylate synthase (FAD)
MKYAYEDHSHQQFEALIVALCAKLLGIASYSQESTRYANYSQDKFGNEITVIQPCFWSINDPRYELWHEAMLFAEKTYLNLIAQGATAQQARSVLPNSLKNGA